jgi:hypothetical protein
MHTPRHCPGGVAQWASYLPLEKKTRVRMPPGYKVFRENMVMMLCVTCLICIVCVFIWEIITLPTNKYLKKIYFAAEIYFWIYSTYLPIKNCFDVNWIWVISRTLWMLQIWFSDLDFSTFLEISPFVSLKKRDYSVYL